METQKKYAIGTARGKHKQVLPIKSDLAITRTTKLVSTEEASRILKDERGLDLSAWTIRERCNKGKWQQNHHWIKASKQYLINMEAVFELIITGCV